MFNSAEHEICPAYKFQITNIANSFLLNIAKHEQNSANNENVVGIFIFISRENFKLSWIDHEKSLKPRDLAYAELEQSAFKYSWISIWS